MAAAIQSAIREAFMRRMSSLVLTFLTMFLTVSALSQTRGMRNYDLKTETTIKGTVEEVQQQTGRRGWSGIHLLVKTDAGTITVHVGPSSYVADKQFSFAKGDAVEIVGSKVTMAGSDALIAREITKDGKTLVLRNAQGIPEWSGGRR